MKQFSLNNQCYNSLGLSKKILRSSVIIPIAAALFLGACSTSNAPKTTGSIVTSGDVAKGTKFWGAKYQQDPSDRTAALNFASALRRSGQSEQAVAVLRQAS